MSRRGHDDPRRPKSAFAVCLLFVFCGAALAHASTVGDYRCVDPKKVYLGNARLFQRPCAISADRVYRATPEYREILDRGLTDKDVHYHILMKKAGKRFATAVKRMATDQRHDLVAESGAIEKARDTAADIPDRTDQTIAQIE